MNAPSNAPSNASGNASSMRGAMQNAMPDAMPKIGFSNARTNERTQLTRRLQDSGEKTQLPNLPKPVDKGSIVRIQDVNLDARTWWKAGTIAEKRHITVPELIAHIVESAFTEERPTAEQYGRKTTPVERRKMTPRRKARLRELHALGMTDGEIAQRIGLNPESVRQWRNRLELPVIRRGRRTDAEAARIASLNPNQKGRVA